MEYIDARSTSQRCWHFGRPGVRDSKNAKIFRCPRCTSLAKSPKQKKKHIYQVDADLNAARNIMTAPLAQAH